LAFALAVAAGPAVAADEPHAVRLLGSAPTGDDHSARAFVLDLRLEPAEGAFQKKVSGWYAALPPSVGSGEVSGTCVRDACAIDIDQDGGKLSFNGDFTGPASSGRFALADEDGKPKAEGEARFSPLSGVAPGVGVLAEPKAVGGAELKALLEWSGLVVSVGNGTPPEWPDDTQRDALAGWQNAQGEPATGLITVSDLAALRAAARTAKVKSGWTTVNGRGWSAGYPAALLAKAGEGAGAYRFESPDGKASLLVSIERPLSDDDFSALVENLTADGPNRSNSEYTRVNGDLDLSYVEGGRRVIIACHNREHGLARLAFSRPAGEDDRWGLFDVVIATNFQVGDELKSP
jgi:hypothetical protein